MNNYGVVSTYEALRQKLLQYIKTVYLGKNDALRDACSKELEASGCLSQLPYIEANQSYKVDSNGIDSLNSNIISDELKDLYHSIIKYNPYTHQVDALRSYFEGKDLLVATGTGSGKTECFMWPIAGKLYDEALRSPLTWNQRGVRALMLYPMNALVSDQLGRLRKLLGDDGNGEYYNVFSSTGGRRPQFGMYTGRTPYAGIQDSKEDVRLAKTLANNLLNCSEETKARLKEIGKYPAKDNLENFVERLKKGEHRTSPRDAELITRFEMQQLCPDILVTNYSMLEYMLMRPAEGNIWDDTKAWLQSNKDNKLLFIIDEAHMYRGSSGGEVALLIRRLMHRLDIERDRIQFILTTASVPTGKNQEIMSFANSLTAQPSSADGFAIISGESSPLSEDEALDYSASKLNSINVDSFIGTELGKAEALKAFASALSLDVSTINTENVKEVEAWLYKELSTHAPVIRILKACRGHATKVDDLSVIAFPKDDHDVAVHGVSVLLAIAPFAKNEDGNVLFPARLHLLFRGLSGIYACANPNCTCKEDSKLPFGKVFLSKQKEVCSCGGKVFELYNDRACGALFIKGYIDNTDPTSTYVWNNSIVDTNDNIHETYFYVLGRHEYLDEDFSGSYGYLDSVTGRLYYDDSKADVARCLHVAFVRGDVKSKEWTFDTCPKCEQKNLKITDFSTKGNEPFFNLVSEQLSTQPQTLFKPEEIAISPNRGRKVLLFSDSRQKAAGLAKDLTRAADEDAMKKALTLAAKRLQDWSLSKNRDITMENLYAAIVEIAATNGLRFFYGSDENLLSNHIEIYKGEKAFYDAIGEEFDYIDFTDKVKPVPGLYTLQLLKQICSSYRSLSDVALCMVSPSNKQLRKSLYSLKDINVSKADFMQIFSTWAIASLTSSYAYGVSDINDDIRDNAAGWDGNKGLIEGRELKKKLKDGLKKIKGYSDEEIKMIGQVLIQYTSEVDGRRYINPSLVKLEYSPIEEKEWYICPRCGRVAPYSFFGKCLHCFKEDARPLNKNDVEGMRFWRDPVIRAINGDQQTLLTSINAEEHTAQLSHKDQLNTLWSTTEDFEMRFQNVFSSDSTPKPVDVLSCTTTMEVGIDIGSLTAVGLRNIPPMRENYQQRAGRAGRRGAAVSTIITYIDNQPHDNYYYEHPEEIISGQPRAPWIDGSNRRLLNRHLNIVTLNDFLRDYQQSLDGIDAKDFFEELFNDCIKYIQNKHFSSKEIHRLVPEDLAEYANDFKEDLIESLHKLKENVEIYPERYFSDAAKSSLLDVLYASGIMPTYSFPKDVVGFYVEDSEGQRIIEKPDNSLDKAISEYAPGRTLVINKRTYKVGGLYNFFAKRRAGKYDNPAYNYLKNNNSEYRKTLFLCKNNACQWFSTSKPDNDICPFCGGTEIDTKTLIKPWGFAPLNGTSIKESEAKNEASYAENPSYAATPNDQMDLVSGFYNVRKAKRANQQILIVNKGPEAKGFTICKTCGAAVTNTEADSLDDNRKVKKPYINILNNRPCNHDGISAYIGTDFRTDMAVFEFALSKSKVNTSYDNVWLKQAAITLSEALVLCAGRLLDVEFNEIKSGYRIRYDKNYAYLDVFLFDSLSSGAGYCAMISDLAGELLKSTRDFLSSCDCEMSCHKCLNHYWNKRYQGIMNRHAANDILNYCISDQVTSPLSMDEQNRLIKPISMLFESDDSNDAEIVYKEGMLHFTNGSFVKSLYIYPAMWAKNDSRIPEDAISFSDMEIKYALSKVYLSLLQSTDENGRATKSGCNKTIIITREEGMDFSEMKYTDIWDYILDDVDTDDEEAIINKLNNSMQSNKVYEKPIYNARVSALINGKQYNCFADLLWESSKTMLVLQDLSPIHDLINEVSDWNCILLKDIDNPFELISRIEV